MTTLAKISKSLSIAAVTLAVSAPLASHAAGHDYNAAMDSCINAFVSANLPKEQPVTVRKLEASTSPIALHARAYKIVVNAKGVESGKQLARGTCIVNRDGEVVAMNGKPVGTKLAAR